MSGSTAASRAREALGQRAVLLRLLSFGVRPLSVLHTSRAGRGALRGVELSAWLCAKLDPGDAGDPGERWQEAAGIAARWCATAPELRLGDAALAACLPPTMPLRRFELELDPSEDAWAQRARKLLARAQVLSVPVVSGTVRMLPEARSVVELVLRGRITLLEAEYYTPRKVRSLTVLPAISHERASAKQCAETVVELVRFYDTLEKLHLGRLFHLPASLFDALPRSLVQLSLAPCGFSRDERAEHVIAALCAALERIKRLRVLRLALHVPPAVGDQLMGRLAKSIPRELHTLDLNGPCGTHQGVQALVAELHKLRQLRVLDLTGQLLADAGAAAIASALHVQNTLEEVYLDSTDISALGCRLLASSLRVAPKVRCLSLRGCGADDAAGALAALRQAAVGTAHRSWLVSVAV